MIKILQGDCIDQLRTLPDESVNCCVTSPPYWGLRDYGTAKWEGGDPDCKHNEAKQKSRYDYSLANSPIQDGDRKGTDAPKWKDICPSCGAKKVDNQLGLENTPEEYVAKMVEVFREVRRVLRKDGTCWLNLGDSYAGSGRGRDADGTWNPGKGGSKQETNIGAITGRTVNPKSLSKNLIASGAIGNAWVKPPQGLKCKDLCGIPWRVAFALQADGWYLRQDIIWAKPNPMPESVTDRCTKSHEYIFLLTKSAQYYYDQETIMEPVTQSSIERLNQPNLDNQAGSMRVPGKTNGPMKAVAPKSWNGSEFHDGKNLIVHPNVGKNRKHDGTNHGSNGTGFQTHNGNSLNRTDGMRNKRSVWTVTTQPFKEAHFATFPPDLVRPMILAGCPVTGTVLDPFGGSGTTGMVAEEEGRNSILIELNPAYIEIAKRRTQQQGLFCK